MFWHTRWEWSRCFWRAFIRKLGNESAKLPPLLPWPLSRRLTGRRQASSEQICDGCSGSIPKEEALFAQLAKSGYIAIALGSRKAIMHQFRHLLPVSLFESQCCWTQGWNIFFEGCTFIVESHLNGCAAKIVGTSPINSWGSCRSCTPHFCRI